ncbi:S-adenosyl-L-methionine-dependent methyltransferase [Blastocladiella britannica]|nr:S-adenosyl-L-methionine-dependent methyltransferase [Blastocladiella britannica]
MRGRVAAAFTPMVNGQGRRVLSSSATVTSTNLGDEIDEKAPLDAFLAARAAHTADTNTVALGDMVIVRDIRSGRRNLIGPLSEDGVFSNTVGNLSHRDLVGLHARDVVRNHKGQLLAVHFPTVHEYNLMAYRIATPIYPKDASAIISMLDLQPSSFTLETGTGTGGFTLALAAAYGAGASGKILSVDLRGSHTRHARKHLKRFRRGSLLPLVEFVTGDIAAVLQSLPDHALDGAVVDLMDPHLHLAELARVIRPDGVVVVYVPSITQAIQCLETVRRSRSPFASEKCVVVSEDEWVVKPAVVKWPEGKPVLPAAAEAVEVESTPPLQYNWICRPTNQPGGHTAFLLQLRCTKGPRDVATRDDDQEGDDDKTLAIVPEQ